MTKRRDYGDEIWDRLLDFLDAPDESNEPKSIAEIDAELARRGIDPSPTIARVLQAVESAKARAALDDAKRDRARALERLSTVSGNIVDSLRSRIGEIISTRLSGTLQAAYFRKLERSATDQDLQTLLEDIERLEALEDSDDED